MLRAAQITTLKNGLRVATSRRAGNTGIQLITGAGSRHDSISGSASVLGNHVFGKGKAELDACNLGGAYTAEVSREETALSLTVGKASSAAALSWLGKVVSAPAFGDKEVEAAKASHLSSSDHEAGFLGARGGMTRGVLQDRLQMSCFRDNALGNPLNGTPEDIACISGGSLKQFHADNFNSNKMVLSVVGDFDHAEVVKSAEAAFGSLKPKALPSIVEKPYFLGGDLLYRNDEMGANAYIALCYEGVPLMSSDSICFDLMAQIIGEYDKSAAPTVPQTISANRTMNEIARKMDVGCANHYKMFNKQYTDTGMFVWFAEVDELAVEHLVGEMIFGVNMLSSSLTDEEAERAKRELKRQVCSAVETNSGAAAKIAKNVLNYGRHMTTEEYCMRLEKVDAEDIKRVAWKYLHDAEISITALGPLHGLPDHYHVRRNTAMWRY